MSDLARDREQAHAYIDMLPPDMLNAVRSAWAAGRGAKQKRNSADLAATRESVVREILRSLLEVMVEPLSRSLALARVEDEELTLETIETIELAKASLASGEGVSQGEIRREFGLK